MLNQMMIFKFEQKKLNFVKMKSRTLKLDIRVKKVIQG